MKIAVIGIGAIGRAWTISFLRGGHEVRVWNRSPERIDEARDIISQILPDLASADLLNGLTPEEVLANLHVALMRRAGIEVDGFGDSTGELTL